MRQPCIPKQTLSESDLERIGYDCLRDGCDGFLGSRARGFQQPIRRSRWRRRKLQAAKDQRANRNGTTPDVNGLSASRFIRSRQFQQISLGRKFRDLWLTRNYSALDVAS
jgi:hypothetical protein